MNSANENGAYTVVKQEANASLPLQTNRTIMRVMPLSELKTSGLAASDNFVNKANGVSVVPKGKLIGRKSENSLKVRTPQAVAVARRNARERNRVKQVNNGFAALRQHIPAEIAELFEQAVAKGATKKLSKVETLRMAVEYIRQLEDMLESHEGGSSGMCVTNTISLPTTPPPEANKQQNCFFAIKPRRMFTDGTAVETDNDTQIAIINGQQYIKIPGTQTFKLLVHEAIEDDDRTMKSNLSFLSTTDESLPEGLITTPQQMEIVNGIDISNRYDTINVPFDSASNNFSITPTMMAIVKEETPEMVTYADTKLEQTIFFDTKTKNFSVASYDAISNQFKIEPLTTTDDQLMTSGLCESDLSSQSSDVLALFKAEEYGINYQ